MAAKKKPSPRMPRRPAPTYQESPLRRGVRKGMEEIERRVVQPGKNIRNTIEEGVRKIKRHVGR